MLHNKIFLGVFCIMFMTLCSTPSKNAKSRNEGKEAENTTSTNAGSTENDLPKDLPYPGNGRFSNIWGVWGGGELSAADMAKYNFFKGWYIVYQWKKLEPAKDQFDWNYFDSQMKFAADNNLSIGFMVWVGPHSPEWLYSNGVPQVSTQTMKKLGTFPYYLSAAYKERYYNMIDKVAAHVKTMSPEIRNKVVMWMAAEGSTGDPQPYKGIPDNAKYNISEQQWFDFKKDMWLHMYKLCADMRPRVNLLVNQANDGKYFNWLYNNLPNVWMKAGDISHTYQFNGELDFYNRMKKLEAKTQQDSNASRLRGEITVQGTWFNQNESWNMYALLTSALHFGLDIFNTAPRYIQNQTDTISFNFFNFYAGQKVAARSPGAFCKFRDGLDAADTKRFPESKYGPVIDPVKMQNYTRELERKKARAIKTGEAEDADPDDEDQGAIESNAKNNNLSKSRIDKILAEYAAYGAKRGDLDAEINSGGTAAESDNSVAETPRRQGKNPNRPGKNPNRQGKIKGQGAGDKATSYQKKREANMVINDIGVNIIPDNYYRFLTQYSPNTTSRGYWRVGPGEQPYGRFARGFDAKSGMDEMFFALDKNFFNSNAATQKVAVKIIYLDKGNGAWSLNYADASGRKEAYKVTCANSGNWVTKTVLIDKAVFTQKLEHSCDLSIKYLSGDNTIFNSIELLRQ